ncbi:MAG TPA: beta-eliminating lyase-related protein [Pseudonocardiaceae bacterium]
MVMRSLSMALHPGRAPRAVLERLLATLPADLPASGPDGPVAVLERRISELLGTEAALFLPSGTMAQQVALRIHAERRGRWAFAAHPQSHLEVWEERGYAVVHGLRFHPVGDRHAPMDAAGLDAVAEPPAAVVWELPQRDLGGTLPEWDDLREQVRRVRARGAAAHLDGARIWEAQTFYERPFAEIAGLFDTTYVSLYKSLLGIRGAVLAGDAATTAQARLWRQRLGGGIADAWPLAAAALAGLDDVLPRMPAYRDHARAIAAAVNADGTAHTMPAVPPTPLFHVVLPLGRAAAERAAAELAADRQVRMFSRVWTSADDRSCRFEITVGEHVMPFTPNEVTDLLRDLVRRGRRPVDPPPG